jgi:subtilase family serine protease
MQRFGPSPADVSAVESWLADAGLSSTLSGFSVKVSAPASRIGAVLGTSFEQYRTRSGTVGYLAQQSPLVPTTLAAGTITGILGLNTVAQFQSQSTLAPASSGGIGLSLQPHADGLTPCSAAKTAAAPGYYTLDALGSAYGIGTMLSDGQNGHGATVALYELASHSTTDVAAYESCCGLANPISSVAVDGGGGATGGGGTVEADADIEQVATQAPGASIVSYEGPNTVSGAFDTWNAIVSADAAQVVSTSWGLCEPLSNSAGYLSSFATLCGGSFYPATSGYDVATGLGSPIAPGLSCPEVTSVTPGNSGAQVTVSGLGLEHATISFGSTPAQPRARRCLPRPATSARRTAMGATSRRLWRSTTRRRIRMSPR